MTEKIDNPIPAPESVEETPALDTFNDARVLGELDLNDPLYQSEFKWAILKNKKSNWKTSTATVAKVLDVLSRHPESQLKDGLAVALGEVVDGERSNEKVKALYAIGGDYDKGTRPATIDAALAKLGCLAVRYTTHSSGATTTEFKKDKIIEFAGDDEIDTALMRRYMADKGYETHIVESVELQDAQVFGDGGIKVRVSHTPMDKNRVVVFLSEPFEIAKVAKKQRDAIAMWRKVPVALAERMGLADALDMSAIDPARLFYLPRHKGGAEWDVVIHVGRPLDWRSLELENPYLAAAREVEGKSKGGKSKTDAGRDLGDWSRKYAQGFQIADLIRHHCAEKIREDKGDKIEIECPNDASHNDAGNPDDRACMAVNAGDGHAPVFVIKCQHDSCRGLTNLDMLGMMREGGWFPRELIDSDDYNPAVGDGQSPPATGSEVVVSDGYGGALALNDDLPAPPKGVTYDRKTGQIHPTYRNTLILIGTEYWDLGYNELTQTYGLRGEVEYPWPAHLGFALNDAIRREIRLYMLRKWGVTFKLEDIYEATMTLARRNTFNPVVDYLAWAEPRWDGKPRVERWLETYMGVKVTNKNAAYVRAIGKIVLVAAARRARKPGCKFDEMLILEGPQGINKSNSVGVLGGEWYSDAKLGDLENTQRVGMKLCGTWIHEFGELVGLTKAQVEEVKAFLSTLRDRYKQPYGRSEDYYPRRCIFIGTVNPGGGAYLTDLTGNRRFWPVVCGDIDIEALARDRDQLWAEAAMMESRGDSIRLDPSLYDAAKAEQDARLADDPWVEMLAEYLDGQRAHGKTRVLSMTLLSDALEIPKDKLGQPAMKKLKAAMALIPTWEYKAAMRADGVRSAGYEYVGA